MCGVALTVNTMMTVRDGTSDKDEMTTCDVVQRAQAANDNAAGREKAGVDAEVAKAPGAKRSRCRCAHM